MGVNLAYYHRKDWDRFMQIIDDREKMHDSWKKWHKDFLKTRNGLIAEGFEVIAVEVDLVELMEYCRILGIKNDGKARAQFVQGK